MPTVPSYDIAQQLTGPLHPQAASPSGFAIQGEQQEQLGRSIQNVSSHLVDISAKLQEQENLDSVLRAETTLKNAEIGFHDDIRNREGINARGATQDAAKWWDNQVEEVSGSLGNLAQQRAFDKIAQARRSASLDYVSQHESVQLRRAADDAAEESVKTSIESAIANPAMVDANTQSIRNTYAAIAQAHGWEPEVTQSKTATAISSAHKGIIGSMVDANPGGARAWYNRYKDQILPHERTSIENALRAGGLKEFSQNKATQVMAQYPDDMAKQLDYVRANIKDADRQEATIAQIKARNAENMYIKKQDSYLAMDKLQRMIVTGEGPKINTIHDIPADILDKMTGDDLSSVGTYLAKRSSGTAVPTDWQFYAELNQMKSSPDEDVRRQFAEIPVTQLMGRLAPAQLKEMVDEQQAVREGKGGLTDTAPLDDQLKIVHTTMKWTQESAGELMGKFDSKVRDAIYAEEHNLGKKLNQPERQAIIDRLLMQGEVTRNWWPDKSTRYYEVMGTPEEAQFVASSPVDFVPQGERQKIIDALTRKKIPATEERILYTYRLKMITDKANAPP